MHCGQPYSYPVNRVTQFDWPDCWEASPIQPLNNIYSQAVNLPLIWFHCYVISCFQAMNCSTSLPDSQEKSFSAFKLLLQESLSIRAVGFKSIKYILSEFARIIFNVSKLAVFCRFYFWQRSAMSGHVRYELFILFYFNFYFVKIFWGKRRDRWLWQITSKTVIPFQPVIVTSSAVYIISVGRWSDFECIGWWVKGRFAD